MRPGWPSRVARPHLASRPSRSSLPIRPTPGRPGGGRTGRRFPRASPGPGGPGRAWRPVGHRSPRLLPGRRGVFRGRPLGFRGALRLFCGLLRVRPVPRRLLFARGFPRPRRPGPGPGLVGAGVPGVPAGVGPARRLVCPGLELPRRHGQFLAQGPHRIPDVLGDLAGDVADRGRELFFKLREVVKAGPQFLASLLRDAVDLPAVGRVVGYAGPLLRAWPAVGRWSLVRARRCP